MVSYKLISLLVLTSFLSINRLQSQPIPEQVNSLLKTKTPIDTISKRLNNFQSAFVWTNIKRKIDGGHKQLVATVIKGDNYYDILMQEDASGIYLAVINEKHYKRHTSTTKNIFLKIDSSRLAGFIKIHDKIYNSSLAIDMFKKFEVNRYGSACGYGGEPTEAFAAMTSFISHRDTVSLRKWLQGYDYEKKALGAMGLLILRQKGFTLTTNDKLIIDHVRKLSLPINACGGCTDLDPVNSSILLNNKTISYYKNL